MKHLFAICALGVALASCGNSETTNTTATDSTVVTASAPTDTVVAVADTTTLAADTLQ